MEVRKYFNDQFREEVETFIKEKGLPMLVMYAGAVFIEWYATEGHKKLKKLLKK